MRETLERYGADMAGNTLRECASDATVCETCGATGECFYSGTADECRKCFVASVRYWENRGGCSSEILFGQWSRVPERGSTVYWAVVATYFHTLAG